MNKLVKFLKRKDVGSMGIGALIIFIAMVLVAGIAASVLVQVANTLQMQALYTGHETIEEVATGIAIFDVAGFCNDTNDGETVSDICKLAIGVRPRAGSDGIDLSETYIELSNLITLAINTCWRFKLIEASNWSRYCPAGPTKGRPCWSSCQPGASPMNRISASSAPSPGTTQVRNLAISHCWQSAISSLSSLSTDISPLQSR